MTKIPVSGIILIITCKNNFSQRVLGNRLRLKYSELSGWPIIYLIGDPNLQSAWERRKCSMSETDVIDVLVVKTEDSYINLFKKIVFGYRALSEIYDIEQGIIKCDDDVLLNKSALMEFIETSPKLDYIGKCYSKTDYRLTCPLENIGSKYSADVANYFATHLDALAETRKIIPHFSPDEYARIPALPEGYGCAGPLYYVSIHAIRLIIRLFLSCNSNLFHRDPDSNSYPFVCEDIGTSFILGKAGIKFVRNDLMFHNTWQYGGDIENTIGFHTCIQGRTIHSIPRDIIKFLTQDE